MVIPLLSTIGGEVPLNLTVQSVIDRLTESIGPVENTVDTLKSGDGSDVVRGIAVTFTATYGVIRRAVDSGANLLITHEPTFYNHLDRTHWLEADVTYQTKRKLISEYSICIYRFHDYWHRYKPDGILSGVLASLGWTEFSNRHKPEIISLSHPMKLQDVATHMKEKLDIDHVRFVGDKSMICTRIGILPGKMDGAWQIKQFIEEDIDLLIVGEINEWETSEYVRDSVEMGKTKGLLILGHQKSEEVGMKYLAEYLKSIYPDVNVEFIASEPAIEFL
jgi:putative NIF3 family GTP cyclohydrolase 1 type 2